MRGTFSKIMTGTMVAGAALLVSACGGSETATTENTTMTEMNAMEPMEGTMNDMTVVDGAMDANAMDANTTMDNATTNAM